MRVVDSVRSSSHRGRPVAVAALVVALLGALMFTVTASEDEAAAASRVPIYDTAWDLPFWASQSQVTEYFDYLQGRGYTGVWLSLMNHTGGGLTGRSPELGSTQATFDGQFSLQPNYRQRVSWILDAAQARGLRVGLVPIWGHAYLHTNAGGPCAGTNQGPLQPGNAFEFGNEVGRAFGQHPAIEHWILGGDNFCTPTENGAIWRNLAGGLASAGAAQPMTYHTAGWPERHLLFANESWVDFLSPQTAHCRTSATARGELQNVVAATSKPVFAAEMRYEAIEPDWDCGLHGAGNPVRANDIGDDARAALDAGVNAVVYGHNERWQWGRGANGSRGGGWSSVRATFGAPGEQQLLSVLGATTPPPAVPPSAPPTPPPAPAPTVPPGNGSLIEVFARGTDGSERIELRIDDRSVAGFSLSRNNTTYRWRSDSNVRADQVQVAFVNDSPPRDVIVDAIAIDGQRFESEAATTRSTGTWAGNCDPGFKRSEILHCNGAFSYGQTPSATPPPTVAPTPSPSPDPGGGSVLQVFARGVTGTERVDLQIDGRRVTSFNLKTSLQSFTWRSSTGVRASQVRVAFVNDDGANRDAVIDAIAIDGVRFESEAPSTRSVGSWDGSCDSGFKRSETLHCPGYFEYAG